MRHLVIFVAGLSMITAGCTETTTSGGATASTPRPAAVSSSVSGKKTAAERQLEAEVKSLNKVTQDIIVRNTIEGALVGAAAGCALGVLFGDSSRDCARGAVAGGVVGGVAGNNVGRQAAAKNVELVKRDQVLANLTGVSQRLNSVEANLRSVLRSQDAELGSLRRQLQGQQISRSSYDARVAAINSNRRAVDSGLATAERNMVKTQNEIRVAQQRGQGGLTPVANATASTKDRLARDRQLIRLVQ